VETREAPEDCAEDADEDIAIDDTELSMLLFSLALYAEI
jgi:hypothetical protein